MKPRRKRYFKALFSFFSLEVFSSRSWFSLQLVKLAHCFLFFFGMNSKILTKYTNKQKFKKQTLQHTLNLLVRLKHYTVSFALVIFVRGFVFFIRRGNKENVSLKRCQLQQQSYRKCSCIVCTTYRLWQKFNNKIKIYSVLTFLFNKLRRHFLCSLCHTVQKHTYTHTLERKLVVPAAFNELHNVKILCNNIASKKKNKVIQFVMFIHLLCNQRNANSEIVFVQMI